ncbi:MAG TPA: sigma-70 family RNA polymerase sigma factor [Kofleriaceae bacterium]
MTSAPDAELVAKCRARDADAFRALVERHQRLVFAVALAHAGDVGLAEDVAQEAFVAAWRDLDLLREPDRVGPWVAGIARNLARSAQRNRARRAQHRLDEPPSPATPEDEVLAREDRELLGRALAEVPAAHREALVLYYLEGQPVARIAEVLGVREELVKQRLSRGRRALRASVAARVEAALLRARPGPRFGAAVVAAAHTPPAVSAAGKGAVMVSMKKAVIAAVAAAGVAVAGGALYMKSADGGKEEASPARASQTDRKAAAAAARPAAPGAAKAPAPMVRRIDPATRAVRLEAIRRARKAASAARSERRPGAEEPPPQLATADGDLDKEYIRDAVQGLIPLLGECYQEGLERNPALAGRVVVDFTIEGEPEVGGVVGESSIGKTSMDDPAVLECIQETMYALEIDPPAGGGLVHVKYPFEFAASDGDER